MLKNPLWAAITQEITHILVPNNFFVIPCAIMHIFGQNMKKLKKVYYAPLRGRNSKFAALKNWQTCKNHKLMVSTS